MYMQKIFIQCESLLFKSLINSLYKLGSYVCMCFNFVLEYSSYIILLTLTKHHETYDMYMLIQFYMHFVSCVYV